LEVEPTIFAIELEDSIRRAHIEAERPDAIPIGGPLNIGIAIRGPRGDGAFTKLLFATLRADFPDENISLEALPRNDALPLTVTIGAKTPQGLDTLPVPETIGPHP
jgi:hypothetical protein